MPEPRSTWSRLRPAVIAVLLLASVAGAVTLRFAIVEGYHVGAVDGQQYIQLADTVVARQVFAFGLDAPPTFTRLPGYPLFLAYVVRVTGLHYDRQVLRACQANSLLDVASALLVFLMLRRRAGPWAALVGFWLVALCPLLIILASHALSETLSTFLMTLELFLALQAGQSRRPLVHAALCGLVAGLAQLVRADAITIAPAVALALWLAASTRRDRLRLWATAAAVAIVVFLPWPIRNLRQFGHPYVASWQWRTVTGGRPIPVGPVAWAKTWAHGGFQESGVDPAFTFEKPLLSLGFSFVAHMCDTRAECEQVRKLYADKDAANAITPEIDERFFALARERAARAPFRTYVTLPAQRFLYMLQSLPKAEFTMKAPLIGLPKYRAEVRYLDGTAYALAALGALLLLLRDRRLAAILLLAFWVRALLLPYVVPLNLTQRHLMQVFPLLLMMAAWCPWLLVGQVRQRLARRG